MKREEVMSETQELAKTVRWGLYIILGTLLCAGFFEMIGIEKDLDRPESYCDGTTKIYIEQDEDVHVLPASIDCVTTEQSEEGG